MNYADYIFYKNTFFGTKIPEDVFDYYAARASEYIDSNFNISSVNENTAAKACCAVAEVYYSEEASQNISSEKVGDYSVTYIQTGRQALSLESRLLKAAAIYFPTVGWC